ncbi:MAG TPA: HepT-like ribonuclease domain-containing protein [Flavisolibacter sp.]|jgi:uncharacterized protein with HEPN domain|nr:HepT-like ribonuclease domain-containing protein [Flavisolibacter sp.]
MTDAEKKLLTDILTAIHSINDYLGEKRDFEAYKVNKMQRRAVERELEIIGEAMNNFLKLNSSVQLSYTRTVVDLRNKIIHAYDNINNTLVWRILVTDLPVLEQEVAQLLAED